jgi:nucleoside-diphosphate-sugar epimerase
LLFDSEEDLSIVDFRLFSGPDYFGNHQMIVDSIICPFEVWRAAVFGCGYVGGEVARRLVAAGVEVTGLTRNPATAAELRAAGVATVEADLAGTDWHGQLRGRFDLVVNTVSSGGGGLAGYERSYVHGMESVLAWARTVSVGTVIYTSSTSVYPQGGGVVVDETADTAGAGERGQILLRSERVLEDGARAAGIERWFILRLAGIYGPGRHHLLDQVRAGEVPGPWEHRLNLVHRDDAVSAILACAGASVGIGNRIYNVASDPASLGRASQGAPYEGWKGGMGDRGGAGLGWAGVVPTKREVIAWLAAELGVAMPREGAAVSGGRRPATPDRVISSELIRRELGRERSSRS